MWVKTTDIPLPGSLYCYTQPRTHLLSYGSPRETKPTSPSRLLLKQRGKVYATKGGAVANERRSGEDLNKKGGGAEWLNYVVRVFFF